MTQDEIYSIQIELSRIRQEIREIKDVLAKLMDKYHLIAQFL
jgi:flagellar biosynthesis chaperone FliJ